MNKTFPTISVKGEALIDEYGAMLASCNSTIINYCIANKIPPEGIQVELENSVVRQTILRNMKRVYEAETNPRIILRRDSNVIF